MTLSRLRDQARRWSRVHGQWDSGSGVINDAHLNELVQLAVDQMATDVQGFPMEEFPAISAEFTTRTHMAFHLLVEDTDGTDLVDADIQITATNRTRAAGATIASDLQTAIRAATGALGTETVTWTSFYFTIDLKQGASFTFSAPDGVTLDDARDMLGLIGFSSSGTIITGAFPEDCTVNVTLPSDCISMERVEWDGTQLTEVPRQWAQSPESSSGTPYQYHIRGRELHLIPVPNQQGTLHVWYKGRPANIVFAGYQECGLSDLGIHEATGLSASTTYYFKVAVDDGASTEFSITTATDTTWDAVLGLLNAAVLSVVFSLEAGDLRCTSRTITGVSSVALAAGTTGTNLFATLTGFSAFETAVDGDTTLPAAIAEVYHHGIARLIAAMLYDEKEDDKRAEKQRYYYDVVRNQYAVDRSNMATSVADNRGREIRRFKVTLS